MANEYKKDFPIFNAPENKGLIYFDNAATSYPKPPEVIRAITEAMSIYGANPGRSGHMLSMAAAEAVLAASAAVAWKTFSICSSVVKAVVAVAELKPVPNAVLTCASIWKLPLKKLLLVWKKKSTCTVMKPVTIAMAKVLNPVLR